MLHVIDDDLAVQYLPAKKIKRHRLALACKPHDVFFFCIVPSQNLDNAWNADALKACHLAQTHWVQAMSRRSEGAEGYEIKFAQDQDAFPEPKWPIAFAGRIAGSHVQGRQHRPRPASRSVAPDRGQAGPDLMSPRGGNISAAIVVLDFEYEVEDGGLPNRVVPGRLYPGRAISGTSRPSDAGAASSAPRRRSRSTTTRWSLAIRYGPR